MTYLITKIISIRNADGKSYKNCRTCLKGGGHGNAFLVPMFNLGDGEIQTKVLNFLKFITVVK